MRILEKLDSTINIRPAQNNRSRGVEDSVTRGRIKEAVKKWLKPDRAEKAIDRALELFDLTMMNS